MGQGTKSFRSSTGARVLCYGLVAAIMASFGDDTGVYMGLINSTHRSSNDYPKWFNEGISLRFLWDP